MYSWNSPYVTATLGKVMKAGIVEEGATVEKFKQESMYELSTKKMWPL